MQKYGDSKRHPARAAARRVASRPDCTDQTAAEPGVLPAAAGWAGRAGRGWQAESESRAESAAGWAGEECGTGAGGSDAGGGRVGPGRWMVVYWKMEVRLLARRDYAGTWWKMWKAGCCRCWPGPAYEQWQRSISQRKAMPAEEGAPWMVPWLTEILKADEHSVALYNEWHPLPGCG